MVITICANIFDFLSISVVAFPINKAPYSPLQDIANSYLLTMLSSVGLEAFFMGGFFAFSSNELSVSHEKISEEVLTKSLRL